MEGKKEVSSLGSRSRLQLTDTQEVEFSVHADSVQVSTFQKKIGSHYNFRRSTAKTRQVNDHTSHFL